MGGRFQNDRNKKLRSNLASMPESVEAVKTSESIPDYDAVNRQGHAAYKVEDELHLVSMLNTLKLEPQFYRSESEQLKEIQNLVEKLALKDPYFVAQCIVWSRCCGEGMRSINHVAAAVFAPFTSGKEWAKRFYSLFDKKTKSGGCIYRPDDMAEIKAVYESLGKVPMTNAMKKGFAHAIEQLDSYLIFKYKDSLIDLINLSHPDSKKSKALVTVNIGDESVEMKAIDALMKGYKVSADTWEVAQSEAGQEVAAAVRDGKLRADKAEEVLTEAKNDNWESLLDDGKLGILAALRNLNNIVTGGRQSVVDKVCSLVTNDELLRKGKIMPYQIDLAAETLINGNRNNSGDLTRQVLSALESGIEHSVSNLKELLTGRNLVLMDCSGSMAKSIHMPNGYSKASSCASKAALIAAMILKSTNADLIRFGSYAEYTQYNPNSSVFDIAKQIKNDNMGGTYLASAFNLLISRGMKYDRIFILSDDECNIGNNKIAYKSYVRTVCNPYIYSIDLAAYGTQPIKSDKVHYFFGYGYAMFDEIATSEFNPESVIDKIRAIKI